MSVASITVADAPAAHGSINGHAIVGIPELVDSIEENEKPGDRVSGLGVSRCSTGATHQAWASTRARSRTSAIMLDAAGVR
jgi:hypothetical protein